MFRFVKILGFFVVFVAVSVSAHAQQSAVVSQGSGNKVYLEISMPALRANLDSLFAASADASSSLQNLSWSDVLQNGTTPGVDVDFFGYDASGLGNITTTGTITGDSLVLNKDATISGRLDVSSVVAFGDSLNVAGVVSFADSLRVVKSVSIGERLYVTGVTALGDSLNVVGNVGLEAMLNVAGAAVFGSTLDVTGTTTLRDTLYAMSPALFGDSVNVAGNTHMQGDLQVDGSVNFGGTLGVAGATTLSDDLSVSGETTLSDTLHVNAPGLFSDSLYVGGGAAFGDDVTITGNSAVGGNSTIGGTLGVTGATTLSDALSVSGETTLSDTLHVNAPGLFSDSLYVGGGAAFGDDVTITGNSAVGGNSTVSGNSSVSGNSTVGGTLGVTGATTLSDDLTVSGETTLSDTLHVNAPGLFSDSLYVGGGAAFGDDVTITGNSSVSGNSTVGGTLGVTGATTLSDDLTVNGETTLSDTLHVNAPGLFSDSLYVGGGAAFGDDVTITGNSAVGGNSTVSGNSSVSGNSTIGGTLGVTGATTLSDDLTVNGETTLTDTLHSNAPALFGDSVHVAGNMGISGALEVTSLVINGVEIPALDDTDALPEGSTNLYYTDTRARGSVSGGTGVTYTSSTGTIAIGQSVGTTDNVSFAGITASATVTADSLSVTDVINGQVNDISNHNTDALSEGSTNLYYTDARARAAFSGGTGVSINSGVVSIGQDVATTSDVTFDQLYVDSIAATGALNLSGRASLGDSLVVNSGARIAATLYADSLVAGGLAIAGGVQIQDGNQSAGRVLTSDASGNATWQDAVSPYTAGTGVDVTNNVISIGQAVGTTSDVTFADVVADSLRTAALRITDGNQSAGKVLTSDANGNATWQDAVSPYTAGTGVDVTNNVISIGQAVGTTSDVTFDDVTADSLAMTSALTVGGTATFSDSLFASKAVVLSDSLIVNDGARMTGTLVVDSVSTPGLAVSSAFKYADGSQGANKVLQSNANGEATWVTLPATNPNNPSAAIFGTIVAAPSPSSNSAPYNTGSYIDLPPGVWSVQGTTIISSDAVRGPGGQYDNSAIWVRSSFSTSPDVLNYAPTIGSSIIAGSQVWPANYGLASGTVVINNTSTTTQRYYWWCGVNDVYSANPFATLRAFGGSQFGETSLIAFAVEEADESAEPAPSTITESGDIVIRQPVTMRGQSNPITKPTNMLIDEISLLDDGTGWCTVDMEYGYDNAAGAGGALNEVRVFTLPAGYEFDLDYHTVHTTNTKITEAQDGWVYNGMRAMLGEGPTGWVTETNDPLWAKLAVIPYSATEFRLAMIEVAGGLQMWNWVGATFAMDDPHWLKATFRFKSTKAEGGLARVNISGGTGVTVNTDNEISIGQDVSTTSNVTFANVAATGLQVTDGNQAAGKVLVSDASGNASWEDRGNGGPKYAQFRGGAQQSFNPASPGGLLNFPVTQINVGGFTVNNDNEITLPGGRIYRVDLNLGWVTINGSGGWCRFMMYDKDTGLSISPTAQMDAGATNFASSGAVTTFVDATAGDVTFEVRHVAGGGGVASVNEPGSNTQVTLSIQTVD